MLKAECVWRLYSEVQGQHLGEVIGLNLNIAQARLKYWEERLVRIYVQVVSFFFKSYYL